MSIEEVPGPGTRPADLRASDAERATVAEALGEHMRAGRLTVAEYDERLTAVYAARTRGDLAALTTDLPGPALPPAPGPGRRPAPRPSAGGCGARGGGQDLRHAWRSWLTVALIVWTIYLASSLATGLLYPWPIWVVGPWGAVLLARTLTHRDDSR